MEKDSFEGKFEFGILLISGSFNLTVLKGCAKCHGFHLMKKNEPYYFCNILPFSQFCIELCDDECNEKSNEFRYRIEKIEKPNLIHIQTDSYFSRLVRNMNAKIEHEVFNNYTEIKNMKVVTYDYDTITTLSKMCGFNKKYFVMGSTDTGKSTMTKYIVNCLLNINDKVYYIDCDIGQSEFSTPGCISLFCLKKPVFGPPFSHVIETVASCTIANNTVTNIEINSYLACVNHCYNHYLNQKVNDPLVVNWMGWIQGLGYQLMKETIKIVRPHFVVQLDSPMKHVNINPVDTLSIQDSKSKRSFSKEFTNVLIKSPIAYNTVKTYPNQKLRQLQFLVYFSNVFKVFNVALSLNYAKPYMIHFSNIFIKLHTKVPPDMYCDVINASVVSLSHLEDNCDYTHNYCNISKMNILQSNTTEKFDHLGYGIIRNVDLINRIIFVITPLSSKIISQVNVIICTKIPLLTNILSSQTNLAYQPNYLSYSSNNMLSKHQSLASIRKRR
ncbi:Nucleolar protein 9 [Intoshia linei]|uniref:Nucleolar protein 9 n=1 Tax=Intoshia linei TaxID=1819745 RepID=A0A177B5L6_9BILA|nr:Nucleolar protein 9 [Intoshia linei]